MVSGPARDKGGKDPPRPGPTRGSDASASAQSGSYSARSRDSRDSRDSRSRDSRSGRDSRSRDSRSYDSRSQDSPRRSKSSKSSEVEKKPKAEKRSSEKRSSEKQSSVDGTKRRCCGLAGCCARAGKFFNAVVDRCVSVSFLTKCLLVDLLIGALFVVYSHFMEGSTYEYIFAILILINAVIGLGAVTKRTQRWVRISFWLSALGVGPYLALIIPVSSLHCECTSFAQCKRLDLFAYLANREEPYSIYNKYPIPNTPNDKPKEITGYLHFFQKKKNKGGFSRRWGATLKIAEAPTHSEIAKRKWTDQNAHLAVAASNATEAKAGSCTSDASCESQGVGWFCRMSSAGHTGTCGCRCSEQHPVCSASQECVVNLDSHQSDPSHCGQQCTNHFVEKSCTGDFDCPQRPSPMECYRNVCSAIPGGAPSSMHGTRQMPGLPCRKGDVVMAKWPDGQRYTSTILNIDGHEPGPMMMTVHWSQPAGYSSSYSEETTTLPAADLWKGDVHCGSNGCEDDPTFSDKGGYTCVGWQGSDCKKPGHFYGGYSDEDMGQVRAYCPVTCRLCTRDSRGRNESQFNSFSPFSPDFDRAVNAAPTLRSRNAAPPPPVEEPLTRKDLKGTWSTATRGIITVAKDRLVRENCNGENEIDLTALRIKSKRDNTKSRGDQRMLTPENCCFGAELAIGKVTTKTVQHDPDEEDLFDDLDANYDVIRCNRTGNEDERKHCNPVGRRKLLMVTLVCRNPKCYETCNSAPDVFQGYCTPVGNDKCGKIVWQKGEKLQHCNMKYAGETDESFSRWIEDARNDEDPQYADGATPVCSDVREDSAQGLRKKHKAAKAKPPRDIWIKVDSTYGDGDGQSEYAEDERTSDDAREQEREEQLQKEKMAFRKKRRARLEARGKLSPLRAIFAKCKKAVQEIDNAPKAIIDEIFETWDETVQESQSAKFSDWKERLQHCAPDDKPRRPNVAALLNARFDKLYPEDEVTPMSEDQFFDDLSEDLQKAVERLGYTRETWDGDQVLDWEEQDWDQLTQAQRKDLGVLGWTEASWNAFDDHVHAEAGVKSHGADPGDGTALAPGRSVLEAGVKRHGADPGGTALAPGRSVLEVGPLGLVDAGGGLELQPAEVARTVDEPPRGATARGEHAKSTRGRAAAGAGAWPEDELPPRLAQHFAAERRGAFTELRARAGCQCAQNAGPPPCRFHPEHGCGSFNYFYQIAERGGLVDPTDRYNRQLPTPLSQQDFNRFPADAEGTLDPSLVPAGSRGPHALAKRLEAEAEELGQKSDEVYAAGQARNKVVEERFMEVYTTSCTCDIWQKKKHPYGNECTQEWSEDPNGETQLRHWCWVDEEAVLAGHCAKYQLLFDAKGDGVYSYGLCERLSRQTGKIQPNCECAAEGSGEWMPPLPPKFYNDNKVPASTTTCGKHTMGAQERFRVPGDAELFMYGSDVTPELGRLADSKFSAAWCYTGLNSACPYQARQERTDLVNPKTGKTQKAHTYLSFWPCKERASFNDKVLQSAVKFCSTIKWVMLVLVVPLILLYLLHVVVLFRFFQRRCMDAEEAPLPGLESDEDDKDGVDADGAWDGDDAFEGEWEGEYGEEGEWKDDGKWKEEDWESD